MAKPLFNMSRTLSIGNEGPRALEFALGPVYLGWNPRWTAHVWFDAVRQFNIRPSRMKCRCISLLRLAPPCRFVYLLACVAASPPHKKIRGWGQRSSSSGVPGKTKLCLRRARYAPRPCGPRPSTPARPLSRRWPRSTACRRRLSRAACRPAAARPRWRGGAHRAGRTGLWPASSARATHFCNVMRPRPAASSGGFATLFWTDI